MPCHLDLPVANGAWAAGDHAVLHNNQLCLLIRERLEESDIVCMDTK